MVACKMAEIVVVALGVAAILAGSVAGMFAVLFILGGQAMMFITSKLGAIPEIVRSEKISAANGLINMVSMAAIILGTVAGNWLLCALRTSRADSGGGCLRRPYWVWRSVGCSPACSWAGCRRQIPRQGPMEPHNPDRLRLAALASHRSLFLATLGSTYFWALGALSQLNIDQFGTRHLFVNQEFVGHLLAMLTIGIGIGALTAGACSRGKVELGLVPLGGMGIALTSMLLATVPGGAAQGAVGGYYASGFLLLAMGMTAGLYDIPLQAFVQDRSPPESRGSIMAAYNFLAFTGMLVASGIYWLLSGPLGLSPRAIFLVGGILTVPVTITIVRRLPFATTRLAVQLLANCLFRVRVEGLENFPQDRGALLVANHVSWADGVLLGLACPTHPRMVAYAKYFDNRWLGWFGRLGRIIPIGTTRKSMAESIRLAREALQNGEIVCIFPEGNITRSGQMQEFRPGFLAILKDTEAPLVPAYLDGLWGTIFSFEGGKFFWKWPKGWRPLVTIRFGRPLWQPAGVEEVRQAVVALKIGNGSDE